MAENESFPSVNRAPTRPKASNVKSSRKYERFGETIRYLTLAEWQKLLDCVEDYRHKLMCDEACASSAYELMWKPTLGIKLYRGNVQANKSGEQTLLHIRKLLKSLVLDHRR